jgi:hypothetical protein
MRLPDERLDHLRKMATLSVGNGNPGTTATWVLVSDLQAVVDEVQRCRADHSSLDEIDKDLDHSLD